MLKFWTDLSSNDIATTKHVAQIYSVVYFFTINTSTMNATQNEGHTSDWNGQDVTVRLFVTFFVIVGLISNSLVLVLFCRLERLKTWDNAFTINLAVGDLMSSVAAITWFSHQNPPIEYVSLLNIFSRAVNPVLYSIRFYRSQINEDKRVVMDSFQVVDAFYITNIPTVALHTYLRFNMIRNISPSIEYVSLLNIVSRAVNPVLYSIRSKYFRDGLQRLFRIKPNTIDTVMPLRGSTYMWIHDD